MANGRGVRWGKTGRSRGISGGGLRGGGAVLGPVQQHMFDDDARFWSRWQLGPTWVPTAWQAFKKVLFTPKTAARTGRH